MIADQETNTLILGIITAVLGFLGTVFAAIMTYLMTRLRVGQTQAAIKLEEVHSSTNGLVQQLRDASFTQGEQHERDKH